MRSNLKTFATLFALVGLVSFTSCKKEEKAQATFTATMENCSDIHNAKTVLNGTALEWVSGDQVKIFSDGAAAVFTATPQSDATTAIFTTTDPIFDAEEHTGFIAYYPAGAADSPNSVTIPATQQSVDGSLRGFPMHAYSTSNTLEFTNLCGVLKLHLQKTGVTVTSIALTTDQTINGTYQVDNYNSTETATLNTTSVTNGTTTTTMVCNQSINDAHDFYFYLPAGTYSGLTLVITASDGSMCTLGPAPQGNTVVIERSKYSTITLTDMNFEAPVTEANPLTFEARRANSRISFSSPSAIGATMQYSTDGGASWQNYTNGTTITLPNVGDKVSFRAASTNPTLASGTTTSGFSLITNSKFSVNDECFLYGNIMSLLDGTNYETATTLTESYTFAGLFQDASSLHSHPTKPLLLPATTLADNCYREMFSGCNSLTTAPVLPATSLTDNCYYRMFYACRNLNSITCYATSGINTDNSTSNWLRNVASSGTLYKAASASWPTGNNGVPSGWTAVNL